MKRLLTTITLCLLAATSVYSQHTEAGEPDIKVGRLTTMSPMHGNGWEQKLVDIYRFEGDGRTSADDYNVTHKAPCHKCESIANIARLNREFIWAKLKD